MRRTALLAISVLTAAIFPATAGASDPVGIYAVIDRVVLEPAEGPAERAQIWGTFCLAGQGVLGSGPIESNQGGFYEVPERGYFYYSAPQGEEKVSRIEWSDMQRIAGTGQCIAFGSRYQDKGRVRSGCETPGDPDLYPVSMGLIKVSGDTQNPPPKAVLSTPTPISPADGASVERGSVTLTARNILHPDHDDANYVFEVWGEKIAFEVSPTIAAGSETTSWTPSLQVKPGFAYRWSVRGVDAESEFLGPAATSCFQLPFLRADTNSDGTADVSDAVALLDHLFMGGPAPKPIEAGDIDWNGEMDISDSIYLLNFLFLGGPEPAIPFPTAGLYPPIR